jgi:hypothetical protein
VERRRRLAACLLFAALACGADEEAVRVGSASGTAAAASPEAAPLVVFLGDSLTA